MNCRDAERLLSAEHDGALDDNQRASLTAHVAACPSCQLSRAQLHGMSNSWRTAAAHVTVPDPLTEWHALRRRIRNEGSEAGGDLVFGRRSRIFTWASATVAAALVCAVLIGVRWKASHADLNDVTQMARAEFVEGPDDDSSPVVFVDNDSGWLVIWAVDGVTEAGS